MCARVRVRVRACACVCACLLRLRARSSMCTRALFVHWCACVVHVRFLALACTCCSVSHETPVVHGCPAWFRGYFASCKLQVKRAQVGLVLQRARSSTVDYRIPRHCAMRWGPTMKYGRPRPATRQLNSESGSPCRNAENPSDPRDDTQPTPHSKPNASENHDARPAAIPASSVPAANGCTGSRASVPAADRLPANTGPLRAPSPMPIRRDAPGAVPSSSAHRSAGGCSRASPVPAAERLPANAGHGAAASWMWRQPAAYLLDGAHACHDPLDYTSCAAAPAGATAGTRTGATPATGSSRPAGQDAAHD